MINTRQLFYGIVVFLMIFSCETQEKVVCVEQPDLSAVEVDFEYESLTDEFLNITSEEELRNFLDQHQVIREHFLGRQEYPEEKIFYDQLLAKINNPHIDSLQLEVKRIFGDEEELKQEFSQAFRHLKYYYPDVKIPKVKTITTGFDQDMYVSDSLIIVGLDYYLGDDAKYRPLNMYQYMWKRYRPDYIVPSVMLIYGISPRFNKTDVSDKTVLAEMVAYGKAFYFAKHMMPCTPDSVLIWYTSEEIQGVRENADIVWAHIVENEILFSNSHEVKRKYIEERPKTYEIGNEAPGRIGQWLGWQIVRAYMDRKEEVTLQELMEKSNAQQIFRESKYTPE